MFKEKIEGLLASLNNNGIGAFTANITGLIITNGEQILFIISTLVSVVVSSYTAISKTKAEAQRVSNEFELKKLELELKLKNGLREQVDAT